MAKPAVFIGSSSEGLDFARAVRGQLSRDAEVVMWDEGFFAPGSTFIETLVNSLEQYDFAILVLTSDDLVISREVESPAARDNVLFELGLFMGRLGRTRTFILHQSNANLKIPSDLAGVTKATYEWPRGDNNYKAAVGPACDSIRDVVRRLGMLPARANMQLSTLGQVEWPKLYEAVVKTLTSAKSNNPEFNIQLDYVAAEVVAAIAVSAQTDNLGVNERLLDSVVRHHLEPSISISAFETTGPASWVNPMVYRYLAPQIRKYLWANIIEGKWHLRVHDWLGDAMDRAILNAKPKLQGPSLTIFDNVSQFYWERATPTLQFSRVLLWTKAELKHPIAESVIAVHEAFNIPLFFVEALTEEDKEYAFVVFERKDGDPTGRYGRQQSFYQTEDFDRGFIPHLGNALEIYKALLEREDIMFAADARALLLHSAREAEH